MPGSEEDSLLTKTLSDKWLTQKQVLKILQIGKTKLYDLREKGLLKCCKDGGFIRFNQDDVQEMLLRLRK